MQWAPVKTTDSAIRDPPQIAASGSFEPLSFLSKATIQGNSPYSASPLLFPVIEKSTPFSFLIPQTLHFLSGSHGGIVLEVVETGRFVVDTDDGVVDVTSCDRLKFGGTLQHISK